MYYFVFLNVLDFIEEHEGIKISRKKIVRREIIVQDFRIKTFKDLYFIG